MAGGSPGALEPLPRPAHWANKKAVRFLGQPTWFIRFYGTGLIPGRSLLFGVVKGRLDDAVLRLELRNSLADETSEFAADRTVLALRNIVELKHRLFIQPQRIVLHLFLHKQITYIENIM